MKRRNFFKTIGALVGAVSLSPTIFVPKFDPVRWKVLGPTGKVIPNPAYAEAPYELVMMDFSGYWSFIVGDDPERSKVNPERNIYPVRYALMDPYTHKPVVIPPFITK